MSLNKQHQETMGEILRSTGILKVPTDWHIYTLEELIEEKTGVSVGVMYPGSHTEGGIPLFRAGDLSENILKRKPDFLVSQSVHDEYKRTELKEGDLLVSLVGNVGNCAIVPKWAAGYNAARAIAVVKLKDKSNGKWIRFCLNSPQLRLLMYNWSNTTVQTTLNLKELRKLPIPFPSNAKRVDLENIISTIEDKIELNNQINETLESMAKAIFKEWFIDFGPVKAKAEGRKPFGMDDETAAFFPDSFEESELGMIPTGWKVVSIGELIEHQIGGGWGKETSDEIHKKSGFVIRGTDLSKLYIGDTEQIPYRYHKLSTFDQRQIKSFDIVFEVSGGSPEQPIGRHKLILEETLKAFTDDVIPASFCKLIRCKGDYLSIFVDQLFLHSYGSNAFSPWIAQSTGISNFKFTEFLDQFKIAIPNVDLLYKFSLSMLPLLNQIGSNGNENRNLKKLRGLLLPKLISGEINL